MPLEPSKRVQKTKLIKYSHNMNTKDEVARALDPTLIVVNTVVETIDDSESKKITAAGLSCLQTDRLNQRGGT